MAYGYTIVEVLISRQSAKSSKQKNIGFPIALCQLLTLRTRQEKVANRLITLNIRTSNQLLIDMSIDLSTTLSTILSMIKNRFPGN